MNELFKLDFGSWVAGDDHLIAHNIRRNYDDLVGIAYKAPTRLKYWVWMDGNIIITMKHGEQVNLLFSKKDSNRAKQVYRYIKEYIAVSKKKKKEFSESTDNGKVDIQEIKNNVAKKGIIRNICTVGIVIAIVSYFIWGIFISFNSASSSSSDSWKKDANDAGYYEKNGKWYYQGAGQND